MSRKLTAAASECVLDVVFSAFVVFYLAATTSCCFYGSWVDSTGAIFACLASVFEQCRVGCFNPC